MSSEVCPFCGKAYKRLKSHLPHCKAAASSKTPPTKHDVPGNQTTSSSQLTANVSKPTADSTQTLSKETSPRSKKSNKMSLASAAETTQPSATSSASLPTSAKKKKQKLSEQTANFPSSTTNSISSPLQPSTISKPKKQSLQALIEAEKSKQVSKGPLEGTRSASEDLPKTNPDKNSIKDGAKPTKAKTSKKKKAAAQSFSSAKDTSTSLGSKDVKDNLWVDTERKVEDLSENEMFLNSESGHRARITLQGVRAILGRDNVARQSRTASILSQIDTADDLSSKISLSAVPLPTGTKDSCLTSKDTSPPRTVGMHEGMKVPGLITISSSLTRFSRPLTALRCDTSRADDGLEMWHKVRNQNTADGTKGALTERSLGQVRLRELPQWLAYKTPSHPKDVVKMVQGGWQWYNKKYFEVKKGGIGGLSMLLAGYCAISYIWSYSHIKRDRRRKYH
ncbi:hypothetical protein JOQ06_026685 [Pogonophryne albipinna]|uniref:ATP synthase subunit f, mitochondrial n=1 Tax=Pogonophryne albipinna TaxID=1090488 RepID=A0AAD6BBI5_9TELE|nr:hypothetical protein JOQ06_026685 [Pogonophryne albipinna]